MKKTQSVVTTTTKKVEKNSKSSAAKKTTKKIEVPTLEFLNISANELKKADLNFKSVVVGALAVNESFEVPLAVTKEGTQAYSLDNVRRATMAIYDALQGKIEVTLELRHAQDEDYFVVIFKKTKKASALNFKAPSQSDKKTPSSAKRVKRAADNKAKQADKEKTEREKRATDWLKECEKQQSDNKVAIEKIALAQSQNDMPTKKAQEKIARRTRANAIVASVMASICDTVNLTESQEQKLMRDITAIINEKM